MTSDPATCASCHTDKAGQDHGGHIISDWDYSADSSDCKDCHSGFEATGTIAGVHGDQCNLCHVDEPGGDYTRKVGDGGDGSSLLGEGASRVGTCLTCHPSGTYSKTSIHHDTANATASPTNNCTTACHNTTTGHAGDHSNTNNSLVVDTPLCANCHTATAPTNGDNVPVDATPGNYVHDYCTSCHVNPTQDIIVLITPPSTNNYVPTTMNPGTAATNDGGGACIACHTTGFDVHTKDHTAIVIANTGNTTNSENCIGCHDGDPGTNHTAPNSVASPYTDPGENHNSSGCFTCHDSGTGALTGSASTADINGIATDAAYECGECHAAYFDGHTSHTATAGHTVNYDGGTADKVLSGAGCGSCHNVANWTEINTLHILTPLGECGTCHDYKGNNGEFNNTPGGTVESVILTSGSTICTSCHTEKKDADHGSIDHLTYNGGAGPGVVTGSGTSCVVCHTGTDNDSFYIDTLHNISLQGCGTCHANGTGGDALVDRSTGGVLANDGWNYELNAENGGLCTVCHTAYATSAGNHFNGSDHNGQLTNQTECEQCHVAVNGIAVAAMHSGSCFGCHDNQAWTGTEGGYTMKSGTSAANHTYGTQGNCMDCHDTYTTEFDGTSNHSADTHSLLTTSVTCQTADCHVGDIQTVVHTSCQACHVSTTDGSFADGTAGPMGATVLGSATGHVVGNPSSCVNCHSETGRDYSTDFTVHDATARDTNHETNVAATDAQCTACHGTTNVISAALLHNNNCDACHTDATGGTNGTLTGSATAFNGTNPISCAGCHTLINADFGNAAHTATRGDTHGTALQGNAICTSCHTGDIRVNVHGNGVSSTCTLCHISATDGRFANGQAVGSTLNTTVVGTAVNHTIGGTSYCIDCHSGYADDFDGSHQQEDHSELTGVVDNCNTCHGTDIIGTIHNVLANGCETCHTDVTGNNGENGTFVALSSAENHNGTSSCTGCHTDSVGVNGFKTVHASVDTHADVLRNVNSATRTLDCDNCHTETATNIHTVTHDKDNVGGDFACLRCHNNMDNNGKLIGGTWGDASGHTIAQTSDCAACHGPYFEYHLYKDTHSGVSYDGGINDTSMLAEIGCASNTCHQDATGTTASLDTWAGIKTEHNNDCFGCHDKDGSGNADQTATLLAIDDKLTGTETCKDCHLDKVPNKDHGTHTDSQFAPESECSSCHGSTGVVSSIHNRCGLCHLNSAGAGTTIGSAVGQSLSSSTCQQCHTGLGTTALRASMHHTTDWAQKGNCEKCHDASDDINMTVATAKQLSCVRCHADNSSGTSLRFRDFDLTVQDGAQPTDPYQGPVTSPVDHTIVYESGITNIDVYDYRSCFDCHSGKNPNYPPATYTNIVVKPFHGYPGDWTKGYLYAGAGPLPGGYSNGLDDISGPDATQLPYLYQWYHPGPSLVEEGQTPTTSYPGIRRFSNAMATRMGTNNSKLYDLTGGTLNPNTNPADAQIKDFGKNGAVMASGESLASGLDGIALGQRGDGYAAALFSNSFTVPYAGNEGWGDSSGPYTTVPTWPDITQPEVVTITKAEYDKDGTGVLTIEATNVSGNLSISAFSPALGGDCSTGGMTGSAPTWSYTCTPAAFTPDGTQTVTVSSNVSESMNDTAVINDSSGAGAPAGNNLTTVTGQWVTNGDASANGKLIVTVMPVLTVN
jgi:hypothetical protein